MRFIRTLALFLLVLLALSTTSVLAECIGSPPDRYFGTSYFYCEGDYWTVDAHTLIIAPYVSSIPTLANGTLRLSQLEIGGPTIIRGDVELQNRNLVFWPPVLVEPWNKTMHPSLLTVTGCLRTFNSSLNPPMVKFNGLYDYLSDAPTLWSMGLIQSGCNTTEITTTWNALNISTLWYYYYRYKCATIHGSFGDTRPTTNTSAFEIQYKLYKEWTCTVPSKPKSKFAGYTLLIAVGALAIALIPMAACIVNWKRVKPCWLYVLCWPCVLAERGLCKCCRDDEEDTDAEEARTLLNALPFAAAHGVPPPPPIPNASKDKSIDKKSKKSKKKKDKKKQKISNNDDEEVLILPLGGDWDNDEFEDSTKTIEMEAWDSNDPNEGTAASFVSFEAGRF